ncbi:MAG TPA: NYN domain-containing protein [Candidatus Methanomethylophilaceae archaeon]|nr:NYN domain-containing protein [Candidatus Methanomethylophilaceae archaeon]
MADSKEKRMAILIDADNVSSQYIKTILHEASSFGTVNVKRIYGDWTKPNLKSWTEVLLPNSIRQMQQPNYTSGKNSTDSGMIIDAMDLFYSGSLDGFCLVSSDSDFTSLAMRLKESGMFIVGMGMKTTPNPMVAACNSFKFLDVINPEVSVKNTINSKNEAVIKVSVKANSKSNEVKELITTIKEIIDLNSNDDGWIMLSALQPVLIKIKPEFDTRNYGFKKMLPLIESLNSFEIKNEITNLQNPDAHIIFIKNIN